MQKIGAGVVALIAVSGAGAAVAATQLGSPQEESRAVVNDAAQELGVTPERLTNALKTALKNRVDEAVKEGRLTKAQGDRLKARIDEGEVPLFAPGFRNGPPFDLRRDFEFHHFHKLETAAKYIGLSESQLEQELEGGKTLADVAKAHGKSVDGLVDALMAQSRERIEQDVKNGELTRAEADEFLAVLKRRVTDLVNGRFPTPPGRFFRHFRGDRSHLIVPTRPAF
jgi:polyhydroxyalkanoate synthesis regulator phasin